MILSTLVVGSLYPWAIQRFQVNPNERSLEQTYIQRNIDATRSAFGLDAVEEVSYTPDHGRRGRGPARGCRDHGPDPTDGPGDHLAHLRAA